MTIEGAWLPGGVGEGLGKKRFAAKNAKGAKKRIWFPTLGFLAVPSINFRTCLARE
jgi:hypothetical protein